MNDRVVLALLLSSKALASSTLSGDREALMKRIGKHSTPEQRDKLIVVGTQVLEQLFFGVAVHLDQALGEVFALVLDVPIPHAVAGAFQGQLPALFAGAQRGIRLFAGRDVQLRAHHPHAAHELCAAHRRMPSWWTCRLGRAR